MNVVLGFRKPIGAIAEPLHSPSRSQASARILGCVLLSLLLATVSWADDADQEEGSPRELTEMSLEELADMEVTTVLKKPVKLSQVPAAVYVITGEEIRRSGVTSIAEALRLAPGVQVARIDSNKWGIGVRGFTSRLSRSLLVLVDGRSVYTPLFAGVYWEVQDVLLEDVDRIEVIRGPGGALWGANAVNGVINIITKSAQETPGTLVTVGGGLNDQGFAAFRYGAKTGSNLSYRIYGKTFSRDAGFHRDGRDFDDWRMGQGGFRMDWDLSGNDTFTLQGDLYVGESGQRTSITTFSPPSATIVEQNADLAGGNLLSRWHHEVSRTSGLDLQVYYDRTHRREPTFREDRDTFDVDFQHRFLLSPRHDINWGAGYRVTSGKVDGVPTVAFLPSRRTDQLFSAFVQDEIRLLSDQLRLTVGSKFEHNDYSGFEAQPSVRLLWLAAPRQTVWAAVSRAVRTPSRLEHDLALTALVDPTIPAFISVVGDKEFVSEKLLAYELGYRTQPAPRFFLDVTAFYNVYHDLLSLEPGALFLEPSPPPPHLVFPVFLRNKMDARTYGGELAADWRVSNRWRLNTTYSFLQVNLEKEADSLDASTERSTEGSSPHHQVSVESFVSLPKNLEFDVVFHFVDDLPSQAVGSYPTADVRFGWRPTEALELSIVGQNLLQPHHAEFGGGTEVKRGVYGKITWRP